MNRFVVFIYVLLTSYLGFSQTEDEPVLWSQELNKISDTEFELIIKADILKDWHVYSQFTAEGGSQPSEFIFEKVGEEIELIGIAEESETVTAYSDIFEVEETYFKEQLTFTQKIKILKEDVAVVKLLLYYQVCKDVCIPGEQEFVFALDGGPVNLEEKTSINFGS